MWADKEWMKDVYDIVHLQEHQRVNHFRNHFEVLLHVFITSLVNKKRQPDQEPQTDKETT